MSVTQDYKVLTLTAAEHHATHHALYERIGVLRATIEFFKPLRTHTSLVRELGAELDAAQSALAKVRA